ncbi:MAG: Bug family tripartite tricarboxylate transporter substrate binding protein [Beijerinckiaceae bacterium]
MLRQTGAAIAGFAAVLALLTSSQAQDGAQFFKGKAMTIVTSTGSGGNYDLVARLIARHMPKHVGAESIVVRNMPGGGNVVATNFMFNIAPKDGTSIAVVNNAIPLHQVLDGRNVRFDAAKFNWIGSTGGRNEAIFIFRTAGIKTVADLQKKEAVLGGTGPASSIVIYPTVMNNLLGTKFRIITGYKSSKDVFLAMERGEIVARSGSLTSIHTTFPKWMTEKKLYFLAQIGLKRDAEIPEAPLLTELAQNEEQKKIMALISSPGQLGQPYLAPPGVPQDRVVVLRRAFDATMADKDFLADAKKTRVDIDPIAGTIIQSIVEGVVAAPKDIVAKARKASGKK